MPQREGPLCYEQIDFRRLPAFAGWKAIYSRSGELSAPSVIDSHTCHLCGQNGDRWNLKSQSMLERGGQFPLVMVSFLVGFLNQWFYLTIGLHQVWGSSCERQTSGKKTLQKWAQKQECFTCICHPRFSCSFCLAGRFFTIEPPRKLQCVSCQPLNMPPLTTNGKPRGFRGRQTWFVSYLYHLVTKWSWEVLKNKI